MNKTPNETTENTTIPPQKAKHRHPYTIVTFKRRNVSQNAFVSRTCGEIFGEVKCR